MDKIKIEFSSSNFEYSYRVPSNFSWFEMSRFFEDSSYRLYERIIYNGGKLFFHKSAYINKEKVEFNIDSTQRSDLIKIFLKNLIEHEGVNPITYEFVKTLNINIEAIMAVVDVESHLYNECSKNLEDSYKILGISKGEYSKEELLKVVESRINNILDAYNSIVKQKLLKK